MFAFGTWMRSDRSTLTHPSTHSPTPTHTHTHTPTHTLTHTAMLTHIDREIHTVMVVDLKNTIGRNGAVGAAMRSDAYLNLL